MSTYRRSSDQLHVNLEAIQSLVRKPTKIEKRRHQFVRVPWPWIEALAGLSGQTYRVALLLLHQHWKNGGQPIKVANAMLKIDAVPAETKRKALLRLEARGLVTVERRPRRSPIVTLLRVT
jgi:hypothetical protein